MFSEPENGRISLYAVNDLSDDKKISYKVTDLYTDTVICEGEDIAKADSSVCVAGTFEPENECFYLIEWFIDGERFTNHYTPKTQGISYRKYYDAIKKCGYDEFSGF